MSVEIVDQGSTGNGDIDGLGVEDLGVTEYYSNERLSYILNQKRVSDITVLYYNISSLPLHFNELHCVLAMLNFKPDVIGLTETKITTKVNSYYNPHLDGYKYYQTLWMYQYGMN